MSNSAQSSHPYRESDGHPYRGNNDLEPITIRGKAYGRTAVLEVMSQELRWRAQKGQLRVSTEEIAIPFTDVNLFFAVERRKASRLTWALVCGALAVIWGTEGSHEFAWWFVPSVISVLFGLAWWFRPDVLMEVHSPGQSLLMVCATSMREVCFDAVQRVGRDQGGEDHFGLTKLLFTQARLAFGPTRLLEAEYELQAGEKATDAGRASFVRLCRGLAWLNTTFGLLIPGAIVAGYVLYSTLLIDSALQGPAFVAVISIVSFVGFIILSIAGVRLAAKLAVKLLPTVQEENHGDETVS